MTGNAPGSADARLQLHWAAQLLAAFGQNYVPPRLDDSHRSMVWDVTTGRFISFATDGAEGLRLALAAREMVLELTTSGEPTAAFALDGRTLEDAYRWMGDSVAAVMGANDELPGAPEYEMPPHPVGRGEVAFSPDRRALDQLADWYDLAASVIEPMVSATPEASRPRCWPHHFDLATLLTLDPGSEEAPGRTIGVGMSPGDSSSDEPYFYVGPYPHPEARDLPALAGGRWHTEGFFAAVQSAAEIVGAGEDRTVQVGVVERFVASAVAGSRRLLAR